MDKTLTTDEFLRIASMIEESLPTMYYAVSEYATPGKVWVIEASPRFALPEVFLVHPNDFAKVEELAKGHARLVHIRDHQTTPEERKAMSSLWLEDFMDDLCPACHGTGCASLMQCRRCNGTGKK